MKRSDVEKPSRILHLGAADYLPRPVDLAELRLVLKRAAYRHRLETLGPSAAGAPAPAQLEEIIGSTPRMKAIFATLAPVARTDVTVLLQGDRELEGCNDFLTVARWPSWRVHGFPALARRTFLDQPGYAACAGPQRTSIGMIRPFALCATRRRLSRLLRRRSNAAFTHPSYHPQRFRSNPKGSME
jgi:hypothetical protein